MSHKLNKANYSELNKDIHDTMMEEIEAHWHDKKVKDKFTQLRRN